MSPVIYSDGTVKINSFDTDYELVETVLEKGWYYFDETWADLSGPFETEEIAKQELKRYGEFLNSEPKVAA